VECGPCRCGGTDATRSVTASTPNGHNLLGYGGQPVASRSWRNSMADRGKDRSLRRKTLVNRERTFAILRSNSGADSGKLARSLQRIISATGRIAARH
jgi:hypothetical protein